MSSVSAASSGSSPSSSSASGSPAGSSPVGSSGVGSAGAATGGVEPPQTFRLSKLAYFSVPMALLVAIIVAGADLKLFGWVLVLPVLLAVWIARLKTVVTEDGLHVVGTFSSREVDWAQIDGLKFTRWGPARAVLVDDTSVRLPAITFGDMPRLSAASRGRIPDPFAAADAG